MRRALLCLALVVPAARALAADVAWQALPGAARPAATAAENPFTRIYNGRPTSAYPAVAAVILLSEDSIGLCSGTLITPTVVLTAAHCFDRRPDAAVAAFFPDGVTERDYDAVAYGVHPDYSPVVLAYADIALLVLETPVTDIAPIALPSVAPRPKRIGTILGFGQDETGRLGLKEGHIRLRRCPNMFRRAGLVPGQLSTSLCWRPRRRGQDTCHGDSGGPLVVDSAVVGVTSGGFPDCPGRLSWDTNVALFRSWIDAALAAL